MQTELNLKGLGYWRDPSGTAAEKPGTRHRTGTVKTDLQYVYGESARGETQQYSASERLF